MSLQQILKKLAATLVDVESETFAAHHIVGAFQGNVEKMMKEDACFDKLTLELKPFRNNAEILDLDAIYEVTEAVDDACSALRELGEDVCADALETFTADLATWAQTAKEAPVCGRVVWEDSSLRFSDNAIFYVDPSTYSAKECDCSECPICLKDFEDDEDILMSERCRHGFHADCIVPWLAEGGISCPVCRTKLRNVPTCCGKIKDSCGRRLWDIVSGVTKMTLGDDVQMTRGAPRLTQIARVDDP
jgi:hypothetical protein